MELLVADQPARETSHDPDSKFWHWAEKTGVTESRFPAAERWQADASHPAMRVNLDACIQCGLCVRACREVQVNDVIGMAYRNHDAKIVFDFDDPMGESTCVACGECVQACPTGALMPAVMLDDKQTRVTYPDRKVDSLCPYLRRRLPGDLSGQGREGDLCRGQRWPRQPQPALRQGPLRFRLHPSSQSPDQAAGAAARRRRRMPTIRSIRPIRTPTSAKRRGRKRSISPPRACVKIRDEKGVKALAGFGSAKGSNEEAYLFQKLVRTGFGSNNVDHCTRLCHASSVAALFEGLSSGAVSAPFAAAADAEVIWVIGANPTVNHPVAATYIKNAAKRGAKLLRDGSAPPDAVAPRLTAHLAFKPGSDVAMLNAMINTIITEGLTDEQYHRRIYRGLRGSRRPRSSISPRRRCRRSAAFPPRRCARWRGPTRARKSSIIFWGMGISQHVHGTDNARCLIALALITGQVGRPGTGLHPLRGQNNVQGASDAGLIPMFLPDYQPVGRDDMRGAVREAVGPGPRSGAWPDRGRDHERDPRRTDPRHVYRGRKSRDVGSGSAARARGAGHARSPRGAGPVRHRDRVPRRRDPCRPRRSPRRTAPSPTPTAACSWRVR